MRTIEKNKTKPSGFLRTVHLPERWRFSHDTRQSPGESLSLFFPLSFFLNYFTFKKYDHVHFDSLHRHFKVQGRKQETAYL